jgi:hypothetical protein
MISLFVQKIKLEEKDKAYFFSLSDDTIYTDKLDYSIYS